MRYFVSLVFAASTSCIGGAVAADTSSEQPSIGRAMTAQDLLEIRTVRDLALSADGTWMAATVERPRRPGEYCRDYLGSAQRADVWVARTRVGETAVNITEGERDFAGYWDTVWSPDGRYLAMLSTQGGDNVRLYVWERDTGKLRRLTEEGIDLGAFFYRPGIAAPNTMIWADAHRLLAVVLPPGRTPLIFREAETTGEIEARAAATVLRGRGSTAAVWSSGAGAAAPAVPTVTGTLVSIDVRSGRRQSLASLPILEMRLTRRIVSVSPSGQAAAIVLSDQPNPIAADTVLRVDDFHPLRVGLLSLQAPGEVRWVAGVRPAAFTFPYAHQIALGWAAQDEAVALVGSLHDQDSAQRRVFVIDARLATVREIIRPQDAAGHALDPSDVQWTSSGQLLVAAAPPIDSTALVSNDPSTQPLDRRPGTLRRDWWRVQPGGRLRNLTATLAAPPQTLQAADTAGALIALSAGKLWRIDVESGTAVPVSGPDSVVASAIVRPEASRAPLPPTDKLVVAGVDAWYEGLIGRNRPHWRRIVSLPRAVSLVQFSPSSRTAVYMTRDTRVQVASAAAAAPIELLSFNRSIDAVERPQYRAVEYHSEDGEPLQSRLLLPRGYVSGKRYPLVVHVYGGRYYSVGGLAERDGRYDSNYLNLLVLAGQGYAVLEPSMPLAPMGSASDPLLDLDKGVAPAIAKVVEMGIADADRVGVMGVSYGGYTTAGLIARTTRFRAAVALAGHYDLVAHYGRADRRYLYEPSSWPARLGPYVSESQQLRMGVPPWKDIDRYWRNSPVSYVEQIQTPLLLIHGSIDVLPVSEAEGMFVALHRLGKRVDFARYVGEGHRLHSPANILDMWQRMLAWFDEFLGITRDAKGELTWNGERVERNEPPTAGEH